MRVRTRTTARASRHEEHASPSQLAGGLNGVADLHMWILARQNHQVVASAQLRW